MRSLGFTTLAKESHASPSVTAFIPPEGRELETPAIIGYLHEKAGLIVAKGMGMGKLDTHIIRIGHMNKLAYGPYSDLLLETLESYLRDTS